MRVHTVFRTGLSLVSTIVAAAGCHSSQHSASSSSSSNSAKTQAKSGTANKQTSTPGIPPTPTTLAAPAGATEPLFNGMGNHRRKITTNSKPAQTYFDQGLIFAYSFNHDEAIKSFKQAAEFDPNCAMAYWGIALCNGPHINNPLMDEAHIAAAWEALQKAQSLSGGASAVEQDLINALAARYSQDPKAERAALDKAYADEMARVYRKYPKDTDIAALYCESLMDLRPWDLWSQDKQPRPETPTIVTTLELVLAQDPKHPLANHLYIHAVEAGPAPQKGVTAANTLRTLVPAAGHMVHMPAHIDIRTGRWDLAAKQNQEAMAIDRNYRAVSPKQGFYNIYMAHNPQFLSFADMMRGRRESAMAAMHTMINGVPQEFIDNMPAAIDGYLVIQYECPMRFGLWDEILAIPAPNEKLVICAAMRHFTRAVAYSAKGQADGAAREQAAFRAAVQAIPPDAILAINKAHTVMTLADHVLNGEMAYQRGDIDTAVKELTEAVKIEDTLLYMEPPDWLIPARHALGAVLVSAKRMSEAEAVYRADLIAWPENGWALFGLWQCLEARKNPEAALVKKRFDKVWEGADTPLKTSCLCVTADSRSSKSAVPQSHDSASMAAISAADVQAIILDEQGKPVAGAEAYLIGGSFDMPLSPLWKTADADGRVAFTVEDIGADNLEEGGPTPATLIARAPGWGWKTAKTAFPGEEPVKINLGKGKAVEFTLNAPEGMAVPADLKPAIYAEGLSVASWLTHVQGMNKAKGAAYRFSAADPESLGGGKFRIHVPADCEEFFVLIHQPGFLRAFQAGPFDREAINAGNIQIAIPQPAKLNVAIKPHDTRPHEYTACGYQVSCVPEIPDEGWSFTVAEGYEQSPSLTATFTDLAPMTYNVRAGTGDKAAQGNRKRADYYGDQQGQDLNGGETAEMVFTLETWDESTWRKELTGDFTLKAKVTKPDGRPAAGRPYVVSYVMQNFGRNLEAQSGSIPESGEIIVEQVAPGIKAFLEVQVDGQDLGTVFLDEETTGKLVEYSLPPVVGETAPNITLTRLGDSSKFDLESLRGQVVFLDFWASWCGPCQEPMAHNNKIVVNRTDWKDRAVIIGASIDNKIETIRNHVTKRGMNNVMQTFCGEGAPGWQCDAAKRYAIRGVPTCYLIDQQGTIVWTGHPSEINVEERINALLKK